MEKRSPLTWVSDAYIPFPWCFLKWNSVSEFSCLELISQPCETGRKCWAHGSGPPAFPRLWICNFPSTVSSDAFSLMSSSFSQQGEWFKLTSFQLWELEGLTFLLEPRIICFISVSTVQSWALQRTSLYIYRTELNLTKLKRTKEKH